MMENVIERCYHYQFLCCCDDWVHIYEEAMMLGVSSNFPPGIFGHMDAFPTKVIRSPFLSLKVIKCKSSDKEALHNTKACSHTELTTLGVQMRFEIYLDLDSGVQRVVTCAGLEFTDFKRETPPESSLFIPA